MYPESHSYGTIYANICHYCNGVIKSANKMQKLLLGIVVSMSLLLNLSTASADDVLGYLTDKDGKYTGPTVEDNVAAMDTDKNGFADVYEVRAFLELQHGKGYEKDVLDRMEATAKGKSCGTPFSKQLYTDN
jgi:hypothetical protein